MAASAADLASALHFAEQQFAAWRRNNRLTDSQLKQISEDYRQWRQNLSPECDYSDVLSEAEMPAGASEEARQRARLLWFAGREVRRHQAAQRLTPGAAQQCLRELKDSYVLLANPGAGASTQQPQAKQEEVDPTPRPGLLEILLDPRSLQALMVCGGGLLVLGLVVWLWTVGVFDNPLVVAGVVGGANLALLAGGVAMVLRTSYKTAGRAIAMLACVVLPLNLWLYDAQGLVTLKGGGHLWLAALVICALYALVTRLLKDTLFVYTLVAGVTMTGLLFLADSRVERFWEVISPSALLVVIGVACVHAERLFAPAKGDFSRENFGRAFFRAGHVVMASGLLVLLGGRITGWLYEPFFADFVRFAKPDVATAAAVQWVAMGLAAMATYTYLYSQMVVDRGGRYAYSALLTLLWCEVIAIDLLPLEPSARLLVLIVASTALAANAAALRTIALLKRGDNDDNAGEAATANGSLVELADFGGRVGAGMVAVAMIVGGVLFLGGLLAGLGTKAFVFDGVYVAAMLTLAAAAWLGGRLQGRMNRPGMAGFLEQSAAAAGVMGLAGVLPALNVPHLALGLPVLGLIPIGMMLGARRKTKPATRTALHNTAQVTGMVLVLVALAVMLGFAPATTEWVAGYQPLLLSVFFAEITAAFAMVSSQRTKENVSTGLLTPTLAATSACASAWQGLVFAGFTTYAPLLATSLIGLVGVLIGRVRHTDEASDRVGVVGGVVSIVGGVAGMLLAFNRLLAGEATWELLGLVAAQAAAAVASGVLARSSGMRRSLFVLGGGGVAAGLLLVNDLSMLTFGQRMEIGATVVGVLMLVAGHLGWRREGGSRDGMVSFNLAVGSVLATVPLLWGMIDHRLGSDAAWGWVMFHEVGVLLVGLALMGLGVLCRLRSTTIAGAATLMTYLGSLAFMIDFPDQLETTAVYMMIGGAVFFAVAVLLSIYRDRLLSAPERIRNGEGVYRVLHWR